MDDLKYLQMAIDQSRKCTPSMGSYSVGAVIVTRKGGVFTGYTRQSGPHNHAEEEAVMAAARSNADMKGATMYSSMEPCSRRHSKPVSCSQLIISHGFARVVYALDEPPVFVECEGACVLEQAGIEVVHIPELAAQVVEVNAHLVNGGE